MGWIGHSADSTGTHEGFPLSVLSDGSEIAYWSAEVAPQVVGWRGGCECGWRGGQFYSRAEWPADHGAPAEVDGYDTGTGIYAEWDAHVRSAGADDVDQDDDHAAERAWAIETHGGALVYEWEAYWRRLEWAAAAERGGPYVDDARQRLDSAETVSALDALRASRELIELLSERRWAVMQAAREAGASWSEIGAALNMSKQGAHDWYRRAIAKRAEIDNGHDIERAQRVL